MSSSSASGGLVWPSIVIEMLRESHLMVLYLTFPQLRLSKFVLFRQELCFCEFHSYSIHYGIVFLSAIACYKYVLLSSMR